MFCANCGNQCKDGVNFCPKCGAEMTPPVRVQQPESYPDSVMEKADTGSAVWDYEENDSEPGGDERPGRPKKNRGLRALIIVVILAAAAVAGTLFFFDGGGKEKRFEEHMEAGRTYLEEEAYEEAVAEFEEAIAINENVVEPYQLMAEAYIGLEDVEKAGETYDTVRGVILAEYESSGEILENAQELYAQAMDFAGQQDDTETMDAILEDAGVLFSEEETEELAETRDYYAQNRAYYNKILEYQETYGEAEIADTGSGLYYLTGLALASEYNFDPDDPDNTDLLLAYPDPEDDGSNENGLPKYIVEVWSYEDGDLTMIYQQYGEETSNCCAAAIKKIDNVLYLMQVETFSVELEYSRTAEAFVPVGNDISSAWYFWSYQDGEIVLDKTILEKEGNTTCYTMNDEEISQEEYEEWTGSRIGYNLGFDNEESVENTRARTEEMVEIYLMRLTGKDDSGEESDREESAEEEEQIMTEAESESDVTMTLSEESVKTLLETFSYISGAEMLFFYYDTSGNYVSDWVLDYAEISADQAYELAAYTLMLSGEGLVTGEYENDGQYQQVSTSVYEQRIQDMFGTEYRLEDFMSIVSSDEREVVIQNSDGNFYLLVGDPGEESVEITIESISDTADADGIYTVVAAYDMYYMDEYLDTYYMNYKIQPDADSAYGCIIKGMTPAGHGSLDE